MSLNWPVGPLSFEPLSPTPSEIIIPFSDSDSDIDDASRAAKRRKIERLARGYLEGQPLFIFSASLKGPIEDGWVNPWSKGRESKTQLEEDVTSPVARSFVPGTVVVPDSTSKPHRDAQHPNPASQSAAYSPGTPTRNTQSQVIAKDTCEEQATNVVRDTSHPPFPPKHGMFDNRSSKGPTSQNTSGADWLRKDRTTFDDHDMDRREPPSPTPTTRSVRHVSQQTTSKSQTSVTKVSDGSNDSLIRPRVSEFTPVNAVQNQSANPPPIAGLAKKASRVTKKTSRRAKATRGRSASTSSKNLVSARLGPSVNNEEIAAHSNPVKTATTSQASRNPKTSTHSLAPPDSFLYNRVADVPQAPKQQRIVSKVTKLDTNRALAQTVSKQAISKASTPSLQLNTNLESNGFQDRHSGATTSAGLPSAQIVPEAIYQNQMISLHSTDYLATNGMVTSHAGDTFDNLSTQAAVAIAQKSLQDDLSSPEKAPLPIDKTNPDTPAKDVPASQIKPFLSFNTPRRPIDISLNNKHSTSQGPSSTQAMINAITPYDFSTVKKTKTKSGAENDSVTRERSRSKSIEPTKAPIDAQKPPAPGSISSHSNEPPPTPPPAPRPEQSSLDSLGTALPFTLTASTTTTKQQDGQGFIPGIDDFDLNQAIADAGSFLQSWELHADVSFQTTRTAASSTGQPTHSSLRTRRP